ncbi:MAG: hypothetical protein JSR78_20130 [Proteobacteria bacterium]|nr:hypothetical protein [Pseudomonadota bacterium]
MNAHERLPNDITALGVIEQLRDALKFADSELQKRCMISTKVREALDLAERILASAQRQYD